MLILALLLLILDLYFYVKIAVWYSIWELKPKLDDPRRYRHLLQQGLDSNGDG